MQRQTEDLLEGLEEGLQRKVHETKRKQTREKPATSLEKLELSREHFTQDKRHTIKERNDGDLVDPEDIKKRQNEYIEELYKKIKMNNCMKRPK